eukprot:Em0022g880a
MAGRFYGDITPRRIGRTPRTQESPIQIQPTSVASSSVHRSTSSQRGECEELQQPQPSVAEAMTLLGELKREMDALRTKSESQEKMITALSKSIEDVKREQSTPSQSVRSKAVPKDLLLYERRKAMVKESERRIWEKVSRELMTDESDMNDGTILDERHANSRGSCWVEGKKRVLGSPSKRTQPEGYPPSFVKVCATPHEPSADEAPRAILPEESSDFNPEDYEDN